MIRLRATSRRTGSIALAIALTWAAPAVPGQVVDATLTYPSGDKAITVNYFAPAGRGKFPAVVILHGSGGLEQATGGVFRSVASTLASRGYVALIPHSFEKTDHPPGRPPQAGEREAWLDAVNDAVEFAAARPEVDPTRFAMMGYSMGSGLGMSRALRDPRIKAVVSCSGAYPPIKPNPRLPPLLILHGSKDTSTPLDYVKKYVEALEEQDMPHAVHIYNGMGHNFDASRFGDATRRAVAFLDQYLKPAKPAR